MSPNSVIHVFLRIGHRANLRSPTEPHPKHPHFTHNWSAYVEGGNGIKLEHFVEKVIFRLHESFDNPIQVRDKPPYRIAESGYASFIMYIDVYFKNPAHPNKIEYQYDLTLPGVGSGAFADSRSERITFRNTQETFRQSLLRGGAKETDLEMLEDMKRKKEEQERIKAKKEKKDKKDKSKHHKHKSEHKKTPPSAFGLAKDKKSKSTHDDDSSSSSSLSPPNSPPITSKPPQTNSNTATGLSDLSDSDDNTKDSFSSQQSQHRSNNNTAKPAKKHKPSQPPPLDNSRKAKKIRTEGAVRAQNGVSIESLLDLHEKIKTIQDPDHLQRVVDIIGKSGKFKLTDTTLDFDLCLLEADVIRHLKTVVTA